MGSDPTPDNIDRPDLFLIVPFSSVVAFLNFLFVSPIHISLYYLT